MIGQETAPKINGLSGSSRSDWTNLIGRRSDIARSLPSLVDPAIATGQRQHFPRSGRNPSTATAIAKPDIPARSFIVAASTFDVTGRLVFGCGGSHPGRADR